MRIKDLTVEEFKSLVREAVEEILQDMLIYPDEGKALKDSVRQQLLQMRGRRQNVK